jgi:DNA-binding NarL/FixJ family response regulator
MPLRLLLADDHAIVRDGLRSLLSEESDLVVVAEASDGHEAVRLAREHLPDVVVMDVEMPSLNGIEATRQLRGEFPDCRVVALSMYSTPRLVLEMFRAGAAGYLLKDCVFEELVRAIRDVQSGRRYVSSAIADVVVDEAVAAGQQPNESAWTRLTAREREVVQLLAEGHNVKEIGGLLHISPKTVESHRKNVLDKLGLHSIAELTKYAVREGLTSLGD